MKQYVYRVTNSNDPKLPRGTVVLFDKDEGRLYATERFNRETRDFEFGYLARRLGEINWRSKADKLRQVKALTDKKANA